MDPLKTAHSAGEIGGKAKLGALLCFALACALLAASLLMPMESQGVGDQRATTTGSLGRDR